MAVVVTTTGRSSSFPVTAGTTYYIAVSESPSTSPPSVGTFTVTLPSIIPAPTGTATGNDNFTNAYNVTGLSATIATNIATATTETGEPAVAGGTGLLSSLADLPYLPGYGSQATYDATNNKLYVAGGISSLDGAKAFRYDPAADTWSALASMSSRRLEFGLVYRSGKVYAFGNAGSGLNKSSEIYDVATNTWSPIADLPATDYVNGVTWAFIGPSNTIHLVLAYSDGLGLLTDVYTYDPATDTYTLLNSLRDGITYSYSWATIASGVIYFEDGLSGLMWSYTIATNTWATGTHPDPGAPVYDGPLTALSDGKLYRFGGYNDFDGDTNVVRYDPATDLWSVLGNMPGGATPPQETFVASLGAYAVIGGGNVSGTGNVAGVYRYPGITAGGTRWFKWTPGAGEARVSTSATSGTYSGVIDIYTGTLITALTTTTTGTGEATFVALDATEYKVRVYGGGSPADALISFQATNASPPVGGGADTLVMTPETDTLGSSPGTVILYISNGTPATTVTFTVAGSPVLSETLDDSGGLNGVTVPIVVTTTGDYVVTATTSDGLTATSTITVYAIVTADTIGLDVPTPPAAVQPTFGVRKWVFQDVTTSDVYHFEVNPSDMGSPYGPKRIEYSTTTAIDGASLAFEGQSNVVEWQFSGTILTQTEYNALLLWSQKQNAVWLTDHYARAWYVYVTNFNPKPRRGLNRPWLHSYDMSVIILSGPVQQV